MEREVAWKKYDEAQLAEMGALAADYIDFISDNKTERECAAASIELAEKAGYRSLDEAVRQGRALVPGDKVWACDHGKAVILVQLGRAPLAEGANILGAHIDSPRLDLKQNPLYESNGFAFLDTHYYGGIKHYQWVTLPLALHGVIAKKDGTVVEVRLGEDPGDPVFCVTDLLPHLGNQQMGKKASEVVEGEALDVLVGNRPARSCGSASAEDSATRRSAAQDPSDPSCASLLQSDEYKNGVQTVAPSSHASTAGNSAMVAEPLDGFSAHLSGIESAAVTAKPHVIFLAPGGRRFDDALACELAREERLLFVCGHYEGIDERAYVLAGVHRRCVPSRGGAKPNDPDPGF